MSHTDETFFTVVGCMDGRCQEVIATFGKEHFNAQYPDTITEAGLVGILAKSNVEQSFLESLKFKIAAVSLGKHHSKGIVVHGHAECAGNPVDDEQHKKDVLTASKIIKSLVGENVSIIPVFVKRSAKDPMVWQIEEL